MAIAKPLPKRMYIDSNAFQFFSAKTILEKKKEFTKEDIIDLVSERCVPWEAESGELSRRVIETIKLFTENGTLIKNSRGYYVAIKVEIEG